MQQHALLDDVKFHFNHWRTTRTKRGKIPEYLWNKVQSLIKHYPLSVITNALNLNTNQIRDNINIDTTIHFVEAKSEVTPTPIMKSTISLRENTQTCTIELHRSNG